MPNWCQNYLIVSGPVERVSEFQVAARGYPPRFKNSRSESSRDETDQEAAVDREIEQLCFHSLVPVPGRLLKRTYGGEEETRAGDEKKGDGWRDPNHNAHDWQVVNWGCKWGATVPKVGRSSGEELAYDFDTPWSPPIPLFETVSRRFSTLEFRLEYREPNMDFKGFVSISDGNIIDSTESECRAVTLEKDFDYVCRELVTRREVTLYEDRELLPELHCGSDVGDERLTVWLDRCGWYHVYATAGGKTWKAGVANTIEEFEEIFRTIAEDPLEYLCD